MVTFSRGVGVFPHLETSFLMNDGRIQQDGATQPDYNLPPTSEMSGMEPDISQRAVGWELRRRQTGHPTWVLWFCYPAQPEKPLVSLTVSRLERQCTGCPWDQVLPV